MELFKADELLGKYEELIDRVAADERIIISHGGQQIALVSMEDLAFLEEVDRELDRRSIEEIERRKNDPTYPFVPKTLKPEAAAK